MALTELTLIGVLTMITAVTSATLGHILGRSPDKGCLSSLIVGGVFLPLVFSLAFAQIRPYAILFDWPSFGFAVPPQLAIWSGGLIGGILGWKSGEVWNEDGSLSCFGFVLVPIGLLAILSVLFVLAP